MPATQYSPPESVQRPSRIALRWIQLGPSEYIQKKSAARGFASPSSVHDQMVDIVGKGPQTASVDGILVALCCDLRIAVE